MPDSKIFFKKDYGEFWDIINRKAKRITVTLHKSTFSEKYVNQLCDDLNNGKTFK